MRRYNSSAPSFQYSDFAPSNNQLIPSPTGSWPIGTRPSLSGKSRPSLPQLQVVDSQNPNLKPSAADDSLRRDGGWEAYKVLAAVTVVSAFPCGVYLSFGVWNAFYTNHPELSDHDSAWIGVLGSGIPYLGAPLIVYICTHTRVSRIHYIWVGWLLSVIALICAAFATTIPALIVTQGLFFGLATMIADNPILLIVNTWWLKHRGIAYGVVFGAADLCGVAFSFLADYLLRTVDLRNTFLIFAGIIFVIPGSCILFLRERGATTVFQRPAVTPITPAAAAVVNSVTRQSFDEIISPVLADPASSFNQVNASQGVSPAPTPLTRRSFNVPVFYILTLSNLFQSVAFYLPLIYLPVYASDVGLSSSSGALILALLNGAQIIGEIGFGKLSDLLNLHILVILSTSLASLCTFLLWGFAQDDLGMLIAYSLIYGTCGGGYLALWARMGTLFGERDAPMVFGIMCAGRGLAAIVSGPISEALVHDQELTIPGFGIGKWKDLELFVGCSMAVSAVFGVAGLLSSPARGRWKLRPEKVKKLNS